MILLDTSVCIAALRRRDEPAVRRFCATKLQDMCICSIVRAELVLGAHRSQQPGIALAKTLLFCSKFASPTFDNEVADRYAEIRSILLGQGITVGDMDLAISATALRHGLPVATLNFRDFSRIPGLDVLDWRVDQ